MRCLRYVPFIFYLIIPNLFAQEIKLPSNPLAGQIVFEEKKCIDCHAISGFGGNIGPDLSRKYYYGSFLELAAIIWNHIPQMDRKYRLLKVVRPNFTEEEMLNLIGFIYYLRYLGEPGSVSEGKKLLETKGCFNCHQIKGEGKKVGPDFKKIAEYTSPIYMVQAMWNHGPIMQERMKKMGMKYPTLSGKEIANITAYLRQVTGGNTAIRMSPGNPVNGKILFKEKKCISCHSPKGEKGNVEVKLTGIDLKKSVAEIAGLMWNHSPLMLDYMKVKSISWPSFTKNEMADIIAYLYFLGFEDEPGDPLKGENIFNQKGCIRCHESGGKGEAPDLTVTKKFGSPIRMIQLMWNHAPKMEDLILSLNEEWPRLTKTEMQDIYAYLKKVTINK